MSPEAMRKPLIFVSDDIGGSVDIYLQSGKNQQMVGQVTGFDQPEDVATDAEGNLYVSNSGRSDVLVFAPPYTKRAKLNIDVPAHDFAGAVAISPRGVVAISGNCKPVSCKRSGDVSFYAKNSTVPCATITDPDFANMDYDAFDEAGNLYVDATTSLGTALFGEVTGGCSATHVTPLSIANTIGTPGGVRLDKAGRIAIVDVTGHALYTYNPPKNGSLGKPVSTTPLGSSNYTRTFAFLASGVEFYTSEYFTRVANEYDYPVGGMPQNTISVQGRPSGIAVTPAFVP